jgi:hypothetical protein
MVPSHYPRSVTKLQQLEAHVREQALEMANLRTALDVQFKRIAEIQAELDILPHARKRRSSLRALPIPASHDGNGRSDQ